MNRLLIMMRRMKKITNTDDRDEDEEDTPLKTHDIIPDFMKLRLSTGKVVEVVLFELTKDLGYEHGKLTEDRIGIPSISYDFVKELGKYGKNSLENLRTAVMTKIGKYNIHKHHIKNG
uniref:Uncharacterized protein n=1 Tax=Rhizophagus irregularis (strain DAOM 181602 / DAOM 197198 / MUCL 43194) TaxID=747089 RepID=U9TRZ6_RHIID